MKTFFVNNGKTLINFFVTIQLILILLLTVIIGVYVKYYTDDAALGLLSGGAFFILSFINWVLLNFWLYMFIGMFDSFENMAESLKLIANNTHNA